MRSLMHLFVFPSALIAACLVTPDARAEIRPTFSIRELVIRSSVIVRAEQVAPHPQAGAPKVEVKRATDRFRVVEVLKGDSIKLDDTIEVRGLRSYRWGPVFRRKDEPAKLPLVEQSLLFLNPARDSETGDGCFYLMNSGVRHLTVDKRVLLPVQLMNPGGYHFLPEDGVNWRELIDFVKEDVANVDSVLVLRRIKDPARRNKAIFAWIADHRAELCTAGSFGGSTKPDKPGWGSLRLAVFKWILESCRPEDGWKCLKLADEVLESRVLWWSNRAPTFASPDGRALLLGVVVDPGQPVDDRRRALVQLGNGLTLYPGSVQKLQNPRAAVTSQQEQLPIIAAATACLKNDDEGIRRYASRLIERVSDARDGKFEHPVIRTAYVALVDAYKNEPPGTARNELAEDVVRLGDEEMWQDISGNPGKILVRLGTPSMNNNFGWEKIAFLVSLYIYQVPTVVREQPTLIMERLDDQGKTREQKSMPLPVSYPQDIWQKGWWRHGGAISVEVPSHGLAEGRWRFFIRGTAGEQSEYKWRSEPVVFDLKRDRDGSAPRPPS